MRKRITVKRAPGRQVFTAMFRHPFLNGKVVNVSLGTDDINIAKWMGRELEALCTDEDAWHSPDAFRLRKIPHKVLRAFYGKDHPILAEAEKHRTSAHLAEGATLLSDILAEFPATLQTQALADAFMRAFGKFESQENRNLRRELDQAYQKVQALESRVEHQAERLQRFERAENAHVMVSIEQAAQGWQDFYEGAVAKATFRDAVTAVAGFMDSLEGGRRTPLREVKAAHVNAWLDGMTGLSALTRRNKRAALSVFYSWARSEYDLAETPLDAARTVAGLSRRPEHIVAIRRLDDLQAFLQTLAPADYWHAWAAVACLAGPRYSEQVWLRVDDVYLDERYLRIGTRVRRDGSKKGTKTGRERTVPIEQTTLEPILRAHVDRRRWAQKRKIGDAFDRSPWLFPSLRRLKAYKPRKRSEPGQWSHGSAWRMSWDDNLAALLGVKVPEIPSTAATKEARQVEKRNARREFIRKALAKRGAHWAYGPAEWRHTFGTVLGMCGWTSLEISRRMGNSEDVAQRHYVAATSAGRRWPFKW